MQHSSQSGRQNSSGAKRRTGWSGIHPGAENAAMLASVRLASTRRATFGDVRAIGLRAWGEHVSPRHLRRRHRLRHHPHHLQHGEAGPGLDRQVPGGPGGDGSHTARPSPEDSRPCRDGGGGGSVPAGIPGCPGHPDTQTTGARGDVNQKLTISTSDIMKADALNSVQVASAKAFYEVMLPAFGLSCLFCLIKTSNLIKRFIIWKKKMI